MGDLGIRHFFDNDKLWGTIFFITSFGFFVVPLNFYFLGDNLGIGIQSLFWRYQITPYGNSFINYFQDVKFVLEGVISGISAVSLLVWALGVLVYLVAILLCNLDFMMNQRERFQVSGF
ncbi:MAG: hypothetical protein LUQ50_03025 [Methanospirillum sp.]|uniref:hypothetical protein n=1 Tax=Methanospirillum sp. TaxID=45200 RepID=UPI0023739863|nr:hypothetical protein [Methanospirillum sp.]MDD1728027.1 hypothetical protein [Methanospirillum sp.]